MFVLNSLDKSGNSFEFFAAVDELAVAEGGGEAAAVVADAKVFVAVALFQADAGVKGGLFGLLGAELVKGVRKEKKKREKVKKREEKERKREEKEKKKRRKRYHKDIDTDMEMIP